MKPVTLIDSVQLDLMIGRLCYQLIENHDMFENSVILGLQPRGVIFAKRIVSKLEQILKVEKLTYGELDVTFFRDDFRRRDTPISPSEMNIDFLIEDKKVILIDDVLYTGRTIRSGLDAMLNFGRPAEVELMCLIDRRYKRELPIEPQYVGKSVDTYDNQQVKVDFESKSPKVTLFTSEEEGNG